jgi:tripartite-type tricarboxylate transporter receptor subunit TctC
LFFHRFFRESIRVFAALLGGHIEVISDTSGWAPLVDAGKFRLLAT